MIRNIIKNVEVFLHWLMVCNYDEVLKLCGYGYECPRVRMGTDMDVHGYGWVRILLLRVRMGMGTILIPVQLSTSIDMDPTPNCPALYVCLARR